MAAPDLQPFADSRQHRANAALTRRMVREEALIDRMVRSEEAMIDERLKERYSDLNQVTLLEGDRCRQVETNSEARERLIVEVDARMEDEQKVRATKQYSAVQLDLQLPLWFKTIMDEHSVSALSNLQGFRFRLLLFALSFILLTMPSCVAGIEVFNFSNSLKPEKPIVPMSLVIPTVFTEVHCVNIMLRSLLNSTAFPGETIVVASGNNDLHTKEIELFKSTLKNVSQTLPNVMLVILSGLHQQAHSRNIGANMSALNIVSFFDGDDYLHPQRFEILSRTMVEYPEVDLLLHNFDKFTDERNIRSQVESNVTILLTPDETRKRYESRGWNIGDRVLDWTDWRAHMSFIFPEYTSIANGWSTLKRKVLLFIPYVPVIGAEDSLHNAQIIIRGLKVMTIKEKLGFYRQRVNKKKTC